MKIFRNGLFTGLVLQLAVGPVFFFVVNLALQKSILDGLVGVLAVTIVDYFYITLAVLGIGSILEHKKVKKVFGMISSIVLIVFGFFLIKGVLDVDVLVATRGADVGSLTSSFLSVFLLTISSPMTMVFFTSLFTSKAVEYSYTRKELIIFGLGTGLATFIFMGLSIVLFSFVSGAIPSSFVQASNIIVGCLLMGYGGIRFIKVLGA